MVNVFKVIRIANGLQKTDIAKRFGTSKQNISEIEYPSRCCRKETIKRYSELFGIEISFLNKLIDFGNNGYTFKELLLEYLKYTRQRPSTFSKPCNVFRILRLYEGLSVEELAERLNKEINYISAVENSARILSISLIERYAAAFGLKKVDLVYLIEQFENGANTTDIMWLYTCIKEK